MNHDLVCTSAEFGENFLKARKRMGISLAELAKRLNEAGVKSDSSNMSRLERDQLEPGVMWAASAAVELNTTLDGLVYRRRPDVKTSRELKEREAKALAEIVENLAALNDEYPNIEWFEVAAASARGTRESVEQNAIPAKTLIKKTEAGERTYEPPTYEPPEHDGNEEFHSEDLRAGEDAANYGDGKTGE